MALTPTCAENIWQIEINVLWEIVCVNTNVFVVLSNYFYLGDSSYIGFANSYLFFVGIAAIFLKGF